MLQPIELDIALDDLGGESAVFFAQPVQSEAQPVRGHATELDQGIEALQFLFESPDDVLGCHGIPRLPGALSRARSLDCVRQRRAEISQIHDSCA